MKKILVVGNYGIPNFLNGQTARTRNITRTIKKIYNNYDVVSIDTKKANIKNICKFVYCSIVSYKIIIMPAQKSLYPIINFLNLFNLLKKTSYVVIGGWLFEMIKDDISMIEKLKKINITFVQISDLKYNLEKLGIKSCVLPNYRIYDDSIKFDKKNDKLVYYSRVREDKGVLLAIDAVNNINRYSRVKRYLDIYGPIDDDFKQTFFLRIKNNKYINYCGILNGNSEIIFKLSGYYTMLFPTYYDGEGYPGAILESMSAGVPIIASDWKYNSSIIKEDSCGFLIEPKSVSDLQKKIEYVYDNKNLVRKLSENCLKSSAKYSENNAIEIILKYIK